MPTQGLFIQSSSLYIFWGVYKTGPNCPRCTTSFFWGGNSFPPKKSSTSGNVNTANTRIYTLFSKMFLFFCCSWHFHHHCTDLNAQYVISPSLSIKSMKTKVCFDDIIKRNHQCGWESVRLTQRWSRMGWCIKVLLYFLLGHCWKHLR